VLFLVVPKREKQEIKAHRYDQGNRENAEKTQSRLTAQGAKTYLRYILSARRHFDWHWGLMSQCRFFRSNHYDAGRGYWPNYWMPNPESFGYMSQFIQGQVPPEKVSPPATRCPHPPNVNNLQDPDAAVQDPARQVQWAPGTVLQASNQR
jgi:hypothetical protein